MYQTQASALCTAYILLPAGRSSLPTTSAYLTTDFRKSYLGAGTLFILGIALLQYSLACVTWQAIFEALSISSGAKHLLVDERRYQETTTESANIYVMKRNTNQKIVSVPISAVPVSVCGRVV